MMLSTTVAKMAAFDPLGLIDFNNPRIAYSYLLDTILFCSFITREILQLRNSSIHL